MIKQVIGDIFDQDVEAIVNPVNTVGVMGAGLALQFKVRFPEMFHLYKEQCKLKALTLGNIWACKITKYSQWIICFPTKGHYNESSELINIVLALKHLAKMIKDEDIRSIAIPKIGCGLGGLKWSQVLPAIKANLKPVEDNCEILIVTPKGFKCG